MSSSLFATVFGVIFVAELPCPEADGRRREHKAQTFLGSLALATAIILLRRCRDRFQVADSIVTSRDDAGVKNLLLIAGVAAVLMGLLWIGQGLGYIHWPASSFMLDRRPWALRGAILAVVGAVMFAVSLRRRATR